MEDKKYTVFYYDGSPPKQIRTRNIHADLLRFYGSREAITGNLFYVEGHVAKHYYYDRKERSWKMRKTYSLQDINQTKNKWNS